MAAEAQQILAHLRNACRLASQCAPVESAYNVGALIVAADGATVLATGFSRELPGNTHAEEVALAKLRGGGGGSGGDDKPLPALRGATLYSSMEPCSVRLSGKAPCAQRIIAAGVGRVVMAIAEPPHFVTCTGVSTLRAAGIEVVVAGDAECEALARQANAHIG